MCLKNEEKIEKIFKKHKKHLTYINTCCMLTVPYSCRQERRATL